MSYSRTLVPAYGRDYTTAMQVKLDWYAGKDFTIADFFDKYDGKYTNIEDVKRAGIKQVGIRYARLAKQCFIEVKS